MALTKAQLVDLNANELIIDLDADTSITADTDDQIDIKIAGADDFTFTANTFTALSGSSIVVPASGLTIGSTAVTSTAAELNLLDGVSGLVQADLTKLAALDATAAELNLIDGGTTVGTTAVASGDGVITNDGGTMRVTNIDTFDTYLSATTKTLTNKTLTTPIIAEVDSGSTITLDATTDIVLDADGGDIFFKDDGTTFGSATNTSGNLIIKSGTTTALTFSGANVTGAGTLQGTTITATTAFVPDAADGAALGTTSLEFSDLFLADGATIKFGNDQDVTVTHVADSGLNFKNANTGDDNGFVLTLEAGDTDIAVNDVIGAINFKAPDEGAGTDAILNVAGIEAVSEGDFSASNNATKLSFKTAASEAAAEKMSLSSAGLLTVADDIVFKDGGTIGVSSAVDAMTVSSGGIVTFKDDILIKDGGTIGSASDADSMTIASGGAVTFSQNPVFPAGGVSVASLDIDGATDIGAAIVDADLFIVDDGAGGTNRKVAASRFKTYLTPGIFNLISSTTPGSEGSNITIDNCFTSTYDKYFITFEKLRNGNDESRLDMYLRVGGGSGSDAGTNHGGAYLGYRHDGQYMSGSTVNSLQGTIAGNIQNDTYYHGFAYVFYPTTTAINTTFQGQMTFREGSTSYAGFTNFGYIDLGSQAHTGFAIQLSSGNFNQTNTTINVYGITDAT